MKSIATLFLLVMLIDHGTAQVPLQLSHQGRVSVGAEPFNNVGKFKFALVDPGVNVATTATASATVSGGLLTFAAVDFSGNGYFTPPRVAVVGGGGTGAILTAQVMGGRVTAITVENPGQNFTMVPSLVIDPPPPLLEFVTFWSNDNTSLAGAMPAAFVSIPVSSGLYAVQLGDPALGMATLLPSHLDHPDVRLRVWFDDGIHGFQQLAPDQKLGSVAYAGLAQQAISVKDGSVTSAGIAPGSIGSLQLTPDVDIRGGLRLDTLTLNDGTLMPGLTFGSSGISSKRTLGGGNQNGLDFYTAAQKRMSITANGNVGVGVGLPSERLEVAGGVVVGNAIDAAPKAGTIRWNGSDFEGFTGTEWVSLTGVRTRRISFSLASGEIGPAIEVPMGQPVFVTGVCTTIGNRGVASVTLLVPSVSPFFVEWIGLESPAAAAITSGGSTVAGTHILFLDFAHTLDLEVAGQTSIRIHNSGASRQDGRIVMTW